MKPVARISTRGYYDLLTGKTIKNNSYYLYPKQDFKKLIDSKELTIMIHGLRNDNAGAITKVVLAKNKLKKFYVFLFSIDVNRTEKLPIILTCYKYTYFFWTEILHSPLECCNIVLKSCKF